MHERFRSVFPLNKALLLSATRKRGMGWGWGWRCGQRERRSPGDDNHRSMMPLVEAKAEQHFSARRWLLQLNSTAAMKVY